MVTLTQIHQRSRGQGGNSLRASSLGRSGVGEEKGRRACNYVSGIWFLPPIPMWLPVDWAVRFPPISAKWKREQNVNKYWKTGAKGNDVITNVISANQHFALTFSMQIFKFQRRCCKLSFFFPRRRQCAGELNCSQAREEIFAFVHVGGDGENEVIPWKYTNSFPINALKQKRNKNWDKSNKGNFIGSERELHKLLEIKVTPFQSISSVPIHPGPRVPIHRRWGICEKASTWGWGICQFF